MDRLLTIGESASICGIHIDTLRRWEKEGKITPHYTGGGHRRFLLSDLEEVMGVKKILVGLYHRKRNKMCVTNFIRLPKEGDILLLNFSCFKVEKVVHDYTDAKGTGDPDWCEPQIFLTDVSREEHLYFHVGDKHDWDRDDAVRDFVKEDIEINGRKYWVEIDKLENKWCLTIQGKDDMSVEFPMGSNHGVLLSDSSTLHMKVYTHGVCGFRQPNEGLPITSIGFVEV